MDPRSRQQLTRYGAPAAFLAAVTIAVILVKAGLNGGSDSTTTAALPTNSTATKPATTTTKLVLTGPAGTTTTTTTTETTTPGAEYHVVESGDTLGSIAEKFSTTVDELMTLNPGVDPTALHIGQRVRVK
jgi:LysM repeat protein